MSSRSRALDALFAGASGAHETSGDPAALDLSRPDGERLPPEEVPHVRAVRHGETMFGVELEARRADGGRVPVRVSAAPVRVGGAVVGAVMMVQDIGAQKELERLREEWTSLVAHDLKNPVNGIALTCQVLLRRPLGVREREDVEHIRASAQSLIRMIRDLSDASHLESHRLRLNLDRVELGALVRDLIARTPDLVDRVTLRLPAEGELWVRADGGRLEQVFTNLLTNAVKYGSPGTPINVEVGRADGGASVAVTNRGPGIPADELPVLFERYTRTHSARESRVEGSGLGLYIARGLVEAQGGRIRAESTPGETTTFRVALPLGE